MGSFISVCWLILVQFQTSTAPEAGSAAAKTVDAAKEAPRGFFDDFQYMLPVMAAIMALYFLLMVRPQQKEQAKTSEKMAALKKNDRVLTIGGILGTVVANRQDSGFVTLRIDEANNTRIQVRSSAIASIVSDEDLKNPGEAKK